MFEVQKASLNMFWEYSPSSENLASDWLRAKRVLLWMRKNKKKRKKEKRKEKRNRWCRYFTRFGGN